MKKFLYGIIPVIMLAFGSAAAQDADGCADHDALSRYPGSVLEWCKTENYMPYKIPTGPVTGYRHIGDWVETEGRVTRNFYSLKAERTHSEVYKNFSDAIEAAGFDVIAEGLFPERNVGKTAGGRSWLGLYYGANPWNATGPVGKLVKGTATTGGTGSVFGKKERADDTLYVLVSLAQHSADEVVVLVDVVETKKAETGLVVANAEAMGKDIDEYGRTVLDGLFFDHNKATLTAASKPALEEIVKLLGARSDKTFYVVGHTDATGTYAYNMKLSSDRAAAVRAALLKDYGVASDRLQSAGVGPLTPVFTNSSDGGREKNRRVELVEQ